MEKILPPSTMELSFGVTHYILGWLSQFCRICSNLSRLFWLQDFYQNLGVMMGFPFYITSVSSLVAFSISSSVLYIQCFNCDMLWGISFLSYLVGTLCVPCTCKGMSYLSLKIFFSVILIKFDLCHCLESLFLLLYL